MFLCWKNPIGIMDVNITQSVMGRFFKGMLIHTNYCGETYVVESVSEGCSCPSFVDSLNLGERAPQSKEHCHLVCRTLTNKKDNRWLNGYDENGVNVWIPGDRIIVNSEETLLLTMVCGI